MPDLDIEIFGDGPDLVLLHSLLTDRTSYRALIDRLSGKRRLIVINMPGFGSSPPATPLAGFARDIVGAMDDLGLPQSTDVLGNGLGGFVALRMAIDHPGRFKRMVLVGSAIAFPEAGRATFRTLAEKATSVGMAAISGAAMQRMFPPAFAEGHPDLVADRVAVFQSINPDVFAAACLALSELDLSAELSGIGNKVLIVTGAEDGATPPALGTALADALPDGRFIELAGAGHAPHIQATDRLVEIISPFLGLSQDV